MAMGAAVPRLFPLGIASSTRRSSKYPPKAAQRLYDGVVEKLEAKAAEAELAE